MIVIPPVPLTIPDDIIYTNVGADLVPPATPEEEMRYQMFAPISNQLTTNKSQITVQIKPTQTWDTIMLFNVGADLVEAQITNGPIFSYSETIRYQEPFGSLVNKPNLFIITPEVNPSIYPEATLVVSLKITSATVSSTTSVIYRQAHCEFLAVGRRNQIGMTCYGTTLGIMDFSRKDREFDGSITLIERGYADTIAFKFELETSTIADAKEFLADLRAKPCGYIGDINEPATYIMGLYRDFTIPIENYTWSQAEIQVESVVRTGVTPVKNIGLQAVFVDHSAPILTCIDELDELGLFAKLYLNDESVLTEQSVRAIVPLGRAPLTEETLEWVVNWANAPEPVGEEEYVDPADLEWSSLVVNTSCDEWLAVFTWPVNYSGSKLLPNVASIVLVFNPASQETLVSNAVTLIVSTDEVPCTPTTVFGAWWNETTQAYDTSHVYGVVAPLDVRAIATIFDNNYYLANNPDVAVAISSGQFEHAYNHYWHHGDAENRKPNQWFDPAYYKSTNSDVVEKLWPNVPHYFENTLQHYQMFGYGEGRFPISPVELASIQTTPVGEFYWTARVGKNQCSNGNFSVIWEWEFSGANPPKIEIAGDTVVVCAEVIASGTDLAPVSPGVLTLRPFIQFPAEVEDLPLPEPIALEPITLTLQQFFTGWDIGSGYYEWLVVREDITGTWTAGVEGDLTECVVSWDVRWLGDQLSLPTFTNDPVLGTLQVSNVTVAGTVEAQATVTGRHGTVTLEKIYLKLGGYVFDLMEEIQPPAGECLDPTWKDGTTLAIGYVKVV